MRDVNRIPNFMYEIGDLWMKTCSNLRFGQLMVNFIAWYGDPFYLEEDVFLKKMREYLLTLK